MINVFLWFPNEQVVYVKKIKFINVIWKVFWRLGLFNNVDLYAQIANS